MGTRLNRKGSPLKALRNLIAVLGIASASYAAGDGYGLPFQSPPTCGAFAAQTPGYADPAIVPDSSDRGGHHFTVCEFEDGTVFTIWDDGKLDGMRADGSSIFDPASELEARR